jgi:hypothetical protein
MEQEAGVQPGDDRRSREETSGPSGEELERDKPTSTLSDERFRAFLSAAFDAYYDWDLKTDDLEMSDQIDTLLGLKPGCLPRRF